MNFNWFDEGLRVFPGGSDGKASARNAGDPGLIPGSGWQPTPVLLPEKLYGLSAEKPGSRQSMELQRVAHD